MHTTNLTLLTIVGEAILKDRLLAELERPTLHDGLRAALVPAVASVRGSSRYKSPH